jgi:hypothetical protein
MCMNEKPLLGNTLAELFDPAGGATTLALSTAGDDERAAVSTVKRSKLWQLAPKYHCPIIGTCLSVEELGKFARRFDFSGRPGNVYALHVEAVGWAKTGNEVSEAIQKHLDRKYAATLACFAEAKTDQAVRALWDEHAARGAVAAAMWAALTHKRAEDETRHAVYAEVHMLSHQIGAGQAADLRRLAHLENENAALRAERAQAQRGRADAQANAQVQALQRDVEELRNDTASLAGTRERLAALENGVAMTEMGRRLVALRTENHALRGVAERADGLAGKVAALTRELETARLAVLRLGEEHEALERLLLAVGDTASTAGNRGEPGACQADCTRCENAGTARCVLCVGGRPSLVAHYRALAERLGIRLIHHDGGLEESLSRLPEMINSADAVLCPTDCIGHAAYYRLKQHCRRTNKPCLLFKGAGVSSFALALSDLSAGRVTLCGPEARQ